MAKKAESMTKAEGEAVAKMEALRKSIGDKPATDAQKKQIADYKKTIGAERFVRIGNKRVPEALAALKGVAGLTGAGYVCSEPQAKAIVAALTDAVATVEKALAGKKESAAGFKLPTT